MPCPFAEHLGNSRCRHLGCSRKQKCLQKVVVAVVLILSPLQTVLGRLDSLYKIYSIIAKGKDTNYFLPVPLLPPGCESPSHLTQNMELVTLFYPCPLIIYSQQSSHSDNSKIQSSGGFEKKTQVYKTLHNTPIVLLSPTSPCFSLTTS